METLEIRAVYCVDAPSHLGMIDGWERLDLWQLKDRRDVRIFLSLDIGMHNVVGTNIFGLEICTIEYARRDGTHGKRQYVMLVDEFDWLTLKPKITARVEACERDNWDKSLAELRKQFIWEYETKQTSRKKLKPLPKDFFSDFDWDDED